MRAACFVVCVLALASVPRASSAESTVVRGATHRIQGIVTSIDGKNVTIAPVALGRSVSGRAEEGRTKVTIDGRPARLSEVKVTQAAKAELGLDEIWVSLQIGRAPR